MGARLPLALLIIVGQLVMGAHRDNMLTWAPDMMRERASKRARASGGHRRDQASGARKSDVGKPAKVLEVKARNDATQAGQLKRPKDGGHLNGTQSVRTAVGLQTVTRI